MLDAILIVVVIYYTLGLIFLYADDEEAAAHFLEWPVRVWHNVKKMIRK